MKALPKYTCLISCLVALFISTATFASTLTNFQGTPAKLEEHLAKDSWTVVVLWASWCKISNKIIHEYVDFDFVRSDYNARILGISLDGLENKEKAAAFITKHNIEFNNLIGKYDDLSALFSRLAGVAWQGTPAFLIYAPGGKLIAAEQGGVPANVIQNFILNQSR